MLNIAFRMPRGNVMCKILKLAKRWAGKIELWSSRDLR